MNVNKKFSRLRQWGKERMGAEIKSGASNDFKAMETEMNLRNDGLEKMHGSMTAYVKSLNQRNEGDNREKVTAIASMGSSMTKHGEDFEEDSNFGQCLTKFGLAHQRIARIQDSYATQASESWLDALERSLVQMREYQNARKKLDVRRLAYDTSLAKIERAKREDFRAEEEVRSQRAKFEESTDDVQRRMQDIIESEEANLNDLQYFLEAEISYHERCREILLLLQRDWPSGASTCGDPDSRKGTRCRESRSSCIPQNTSIPSAAENDSQPLPKPNPPFRNSSRASSANSSPRREPNPPFGRRTTSDSYQSRIETPLTMSTSSTAPRFGPSRARGWNPQETHDESHGDEDDADASSSPDQHSYWDASYSTRSSSPATSVSCANSTASTPYYERKGSWPGLENTKCNSTTNANREFDNQVASQLASVSGTVKKAPPPPPPSRMPKSRPPPPPPPMKRSALSAGN